VAERRQNLQRLLANVLRPSASEWGLAVQAQRRSRLVKWVFAMLFERSRLNRAAFIHPISSVDVEGTRVYGVRNRFLVAPCGIDSALMPSNWM
jgi:hypothetical protein